MFNFLPTAYAGNPMLTAFLTAVLLCFVGATLTQLSFLWGLFARFSFHKPAVRAAEPVFFEKNQPPVSVVICARNEGENLKKNLPSVLEQDYPNFEVLVVDDDSDDDTEETLSDFQEKYPQLRVFQLVGKRRAGKKDALAEGIAAARYENVLLTDADCRPASRQWLAKMASRLSQKNERQPGAEIVLGYGPYHNDGSRSWLNRWIRFEAIHTAQQYFSFALAGVPYMGVGRNLAWNKRLFRAAEGFRRHAHLPSGDDDLFVNAVARRSNTAICIEPEAFVYSEPKTRWRDYYRQKSRHFTTGKHYRLHHQLLLGLWSLSHTLHYFCMCILLIFNFGTIFVFALYLTRLFSVILVYAPTLRKLREMRLLPLVPVFDAFLAMFHVVFAPIILLHNNQSNRSQTHSWT